MYSYSKRYLRTLLMIAVLSMLIASFAIIGIPVIKTSIAPAAAQEAPVTVQFANGFMSVPESAGTVTVDVTLSNETSATVTVKVVPFDNGATHDVDYEAPSDETLTFSPGETKKSIQIRIIDDSSPEGNESIGLNLGDATGATLGSQKGAVIIIVDNDAGNSTTTTTPSATASPSATPTATPNGTATPGPAVVHKDLPMTIRYMWAPEALTPIPSAEPTAAPSATPEPPDDETAVVTPEATPTITPTPTIAPATVSEDSNGSNTILWLALLIIAIIAAGLAYYFIRKK